jgi:hypothetical protein
MADKRQQFKQRLEQLQEVIMSGLSFYAVWNKLRLHDEKEVSWSLDRQNQILGRWNGFFTPVGIGLQRMAMLEFAKVFDPDARTVSLTNLLKEAERDRSVIPHAQASDLTDISGRLQQAEATLKTIVTLRNQRLAHADARPDPLPPLMSQQMDSLIEDIKFAFNRLSAAHDKNVYSWNYALDRTGRDTTAVLRLLLKEIERTEMEHDDRMVEIVVGHIRGMETTLGRSLDDEEMASVARQFALTSEQERRVQGTRGSYIIDDALQG